MVHLLALSLMQLWLYHDLALANNRHYVKYDLLHRELGLEALSTAVRLA